MDEKLDFSLPPKKPAGPLVNKVIVALLLVLTALAVVNLLKNSTPGDSAPQARTTGLATGQVKQLATKLAQKSSIPPAHGPPKKKRPADSASMSVQKPRPVVSPVHGSVVCVGSRRQKG